jgi:hypothetical protein
MFTSRTVVPIVAFGAGLAASRASGTRDKPSVPAGTIAVLVAARLATVVESHPAIKLASAATAMTPIVRRATAQK